MHLTPSRYVLMELNHERAVEGKTKDSMEATIHSNAECEKKTTDWLCSPINRVPSLSLGFSHAIFHTWSARCQPLIKHFLCASLKVGGRSEHVSISQFLQLQSLLSSQLQ